MSRFFSDRSTGLALSAIALVIVGLALTPTPAPASFPGANGKLAFTSERDGDNEVFVMNPDGSKPTNLTNNAVFDDDPAYSPDGSKITFVSVRDGNFEIYVMNADGSAPRRLTNNAASDTDPAFSADGSKITFSSDRDGNYLQVYVMNAADGTGQTNLTGNAKLILTRRSHRTARRSPSRASAMATSRCT